MNWTMIKNMTTQAAEKQIDVQRHKDWALGCIVLLLFIILLNSLNAQCRILSLAIFPIIARENEPFSVTVLLRNLATEPHTYSLSIFVNGILVLQAESRIDASSIQSFSYTYAYPKIGSAIRIYVEAMNREMGEKYSDFLLIPLSPPEVWMSFAAFYSFATSLTPTSSFSIFPSFANEYYLRMVFTSSMPEKSMSILSPINVGLTISITLIGLVMFLMLTDPSYGKLGNRLAHLRSRYGLLAVSLFLVFICIFFTKLVMIIAG